MVTREEGQEDSLCRARLSQIRLVFTDCDGVLTDAGIYYSAMGEELRRFSVRDGMGFERLRSLARIDTVIVTREQSAIVARRGDKLHAAVYLGARDKLSVARALAEHRGLSLEQCAFIGDDVNDLDLLRAVGFSGCPADAMPEVREIVDHVCDNRGGGGAFREFAEVILAAQAGERLPLDRPQGEMHAAHSLASDS